MEIIYLMYHAVPLRGAADYGEVMGAFINCYINQTGPEKSKALAEELIAAEHWEIKELEESCL